MTAAPRELVFGCPGLGPRRVFFPTRAKKAADFVSELSARCALAQILYRECQVEKALDRAREANEYDEALFWMAGRLFKLSSETLALTKQMCGVEVIREARIHANHCEAFNSSLRRRNAAFRRKTKTHAKSKPALHGTLDVYRVVHNFIRVHYTTRAGSSRGHVNSRQRALLERDLHGSLGGMGRIPPFLFNWTSALLGEKR